MQLIANISLQQRMERVSKWLVFIVVLIALLVLAGWTFNIGLLKSMVPGMVAMNPLTAGCFALLSTAFILKKFYAGSGLRNSLANILALVVIAAGAMKLSDLFLRTGFRPDIVLFADKVRNTLINGSPNFMAPNTAGSMVLSGVCILLLNVETKKSRAPFQFIAIVVAFTGLLSILGYVYKVRSFYEVPLFIPMALHTAICFLLTAVAYLYAHPGRGLVKEFTSVFTGSTTAQRMIPVAIIIPALLGFLRLYGDWAGYYSKEFGVALYALSIIIVFLLFIWYNSVLLNKRDILRKQTEDSLEVTRQQIAYMANLIDQTSDAVISFDENFIIVSWNAAAEKMYGYSAKEAIGKLSRTIFRNDYPAEQLDTWGRELKANGFWKGELKQQYKDGSPVYSLISTNVLKDKDDNITGFLTLAKDVTQNRIEQDKLKKSEERFRLLVNNAKDYAIIMLNQQGEIVSWNNGAVAIHGYEESEIMGKHINIFYTADEVSHGVPDKNLQEADGRLGHFEMEGTRVRSDGTQYQANVIITPLYDESMELRGYSHITRDITKSKQLEADLLKSNAEMEAFTYSVSHDLRAPLRSIIGFTKILEEDFTSHLDDEAKRLTAVITKNTMKMGTLIDDLLTFSRMSKQDIIKTDFDTGEMVNSVIAELDNRYDRNKINWSLKQLPPMHGDINSMKQVWVNLISNAVKYSSGKDHSDINIEGYQENGYNVYSVKDNGVGFDEKYSNKLFKVFQRLHSENEFEGTGVGLAIVEKIVSKHGGKVWAEASPGNGATFYFSVPNRHTHDQS